MSGLQSFEGEDRDVKERIRLQKEQMRVWTETQIYEQKMKKEAEMRERRWVVIYNFLLRLVLNVLMIVALMNMSEMCFALLILFRRRRTNF